MYGRFKHFCCYKLEDGVNRTDVEDIFKILVSGNKNHLNLFEKLQFEFVRIFLTDKVFMREESKYSFDSGDQPTRKSTPFHRLGKRSYKKFQPNRQGRSTYRHELYWTESSITRDGNVTHKNLEEFFDKILKALSQLKQKDIEKLKMSLDCSTSKVYYVQCFLSEP